MKKVKYIDSYSYHTMHEQFNASLLAMCALVFEQVNYRSGKSSAARVFQLLKKGNCNTDNIDYKKLFVCTGGFSRVANIFRLFISALQNIQLTLFANSSDTLIFNYNNLFSLFIVNLICRLFKRKIIICCHGEMEFILKLHNNGGVFIRAQRWLACRFFLSPTRTTNIHFAVMGTSILVNVKNVVNDNLASKFITIDHSYIFGDTTDKCTHNNQIQIGTVGVLTQNKGYDTLCEVAQKTANCNNLTLSVTGRVFGDTQKLQRLHINLPKNNGALPLEDEEFRQRIENLDYILFLYPTDSYKMIASGAIMDAIDKARPIISLRNDYFEYLFDKYGKFGFLANNTNELVDIIRSICMLQAQQGIDFKILRQKMSPTMLCNELKQALSEIGYL